MTNLLRAGLLCLALTTPALLMADETKNDKKTDGAKAADASGVAALMQSGDDKAAARPEDEIDPKLPPLQDSPIVLAGERAVLPRKDRSLRVISILKKAVNEFGTNVADLTTTGERVGATLTRYAEITKLKPKAVILFTGAADETAAVGQDAQQEVLSELAKKLSAEGIVTFIIPSSPNVSAITTANMRIAAKSGGAYYVGTGTNIGGEPFEAALREVKKQVALGVKPRITEVVNAAPASPQIVTPVLTTATVTQGAPATSPVPINMRPPVALREFDPKTDVAKPQTNTRRKKPSVSN